MNKRLLLSLYDRSGLGAYMPIDYKGHELAVEEHWEKFAELIIFECTKVAIFKNSDMVASADVAGYVALGRRTAAKMITEHFDLAKNPACSCHTCRPISLSDPEGMMMRLCPECGNKRCPKATNHIHACTDCNDPGQEGSIY